MKHKSLIARFFILIALSILALNSYAKNFKEYNIYLIPDATANKYVKEFGDSLAKAGVLEKYKTTPFIKNHPVHLTLYLTNFENKNIPDLEKQLAKIAKNTSQFDVKLGKFLADKSGFVMLDIEKSPKLQKLSNKTVIDLSKYRNKDYSAPSWVKFYPNKLASFKKYGSPNAFAEFNPHISILVANLSTDKERENFVIDFSKIIEEMNLKSIRFKIKAIGFGEVNKSGQVIKTLHIYKLNK